MHCNATQWAKVEESRAVTSVLMRLTLDFCNFHRPSARCCENHSASTAVQCLLHRMRLQAVLVVY